MRLFSSSKRKSSYSFPFPPPPHKEILLVRISSLTKSKTLGNFLGQPWVFLFVKEEFLMREKSSWERGGWRWAMSFSLRQRGNPHEEIILVGEGYHRENPYIPSPSHKEILLERISSLTKRKTHRNFQGQPWVFLFVKEEILTREKSYWEGEWWRAMNFSLRQTGNPHKKKSSWEGGEGIMRITSLTMTEIHDSLFYFSPWGKTH